MNCNHADARSYFAFGPSEAASAWIGREAVKAAPYPVSEAQIQSYAAAVEDANENYWDAAAAARRYGAIIAPPGMFQVWTFAPPWHPGGPPPSGPHLAVEVPLPGDTIINVSTDTTFHAPARVGDRLIYTDRVTAISPLKRTAVGEGHFVTTESVCRNQDQVDLATNVNVMYRYVAAAPATRAPEPGRPPPVAHAEPLPAIVMPLDVTRMVLGVAGTRDYFPGHHDPAYARGQGVRDMFLNTMFLQGLVDRVGFAWAGWDAWLARREFRMLQPACVGETVRSEGRVVARRRENGRRMAEAEVEIHTDAGLATSARLTFALDGWPGRGAAR